MSAQPTPHPHVETGTLSKGSIVIVGIALANLTILTVDHYFVALANGSFTRFRNNLALTAMNRRCTDTARPPKLPRALKRRNMLIFLIFQDHKLDFC